MLPFGRPGRATLVWFACLVACGRMGFEPLSSDAGGDRNDANLEDDAGGGDALGSDAGTATPLRVSVGSFTTLTSPATQTVEHGLGSVPKALLVWSTGGAGTSVSTGYQLVFGMTDGTTSRSLAGASQHQAAVSNSGRRVAAVPLQFLSPDGTVVAEAALAGWDENVFALDWTSTGVDAPLVHFLAVGGAGVEAKVVDWNMPATAGVASIAGVGFEPEVVIHAHAGLSVMTVPGSFRGAKFGLGVMDAGGREWAVETLSEDLRNTSETQRTQTTAGCLVAMDESPTVLKRATFASMDADGFTLNFDIADDPAAAKVFSLALGGVEATAGSFAKSTQAAPAAQAISGLPFRPSAILLASFQDVARSTPVVHARLGLGAATATLQATSAYQDGNGLSSTAVHRLDRQGRILVQIDNNGGTVDAAAALAGLEDDGFRLRWDPNDVAATQMLHLALD